MLVEITFQVIAIRREPDHGKSAKLLDILSSRILDGPNLSITAMILVYLISLNDEQYEENAFLLKYKVRKANTSLIKLMQFYIYVICKVEDNEEAEDFVHSLMQDSSEIYQDLKEKNNFFNREVVANIRSNL
jgi:ribosome-binding factor A